MERNKNAPWQAERFTNNQQQHRAKLIMNNIAQKSNVFIVCKTVPSQKKPGRTEKMPCNVKGEVVSLHIAERMSHDEAISTAAALGDAYRPAVIMNGDGRFCVDIDGALQDDNTWSPLAVELCTTFAGCYVEVSNSNKGLHIFGTASSIPEHTCKNIPLHIELYTNDRFICLGSSSQGDMAFEASGALNATVARYFAPSAETTSAEWTDVHVEGSNPIEDDARLIEKACSSKGGVAAIFGGKATFKDLWTRNVEVLSDAYPDEDREFDESSADAALCQHLAFYTGNNCARMERLMRQSALVRAKWDNHKSYIQRTILNAVARQTTWYNVGASAPATPVPELQRFADLKVGRGTCPFNDHVADADVMRTTVFDNRLVNLDGQPHWWNGQKWELAEESLMRRYAGESMISPVGTDGAKVTQSRINGTVAVLKDRLDIHRDANPSSRKVFFNNCVLDAVTGETTPHNKLYNNTNVLSVNYTPDADCPRWKSWLNDIFDTDLDRVKLLQEIIGWNMVTDNLNIHKAPIFIGAKRAGKGTILRVLSALLNDAAGSFFLSNLDNDKVLAGMLHKNVVIDWDVSAPDRKNARQIVGMFKAITANEPVSIKMLYTQVPVQKPLNCKMLVAANTIPTMWDDSTASATRWMPLTFNKSFEGSEDGSLPETLIGELPGIAMWALEGLRRLIVNGRFTMPETSRDELECMIESGSPVTRFMDEECIFNADVRVADSALWDRYSSWCQINGMEPMKRRNFIQAFKDAAVSHGVRASTGIRIGDRNYRGFYGVELTPIILDKNVIPMSA